MGKRESVHKNRNQKKTNKNLTIIIIIAALVVVVISMIILTQNKAVGEIKIPERFVTAERNGLSLGNPNASVQVIEFADFQCPACVSYWSSYEPTIIAQYVDTGKILYTASPFSFLGTGQKWDESRKSAEAAYCANDQNKFWEYRDFLFTNHNGENQGAFSKERLIAFAKALGLDEPQFTECLSSGKYSEQVEKDNQFAQEMVATFTPSFLIDGKIVNANELVQAIENSLAN